MSINGKQKMYFINIRPNTQFINLIEVLDDLRCRKKREEKYVLENI